MFLSQILEEYNESNNKQEILNIFLKRLWDSKYKFKKYKKYYTYKVNEDLLDNRQDLIGLFKAYSKIEYMVCKSKYEKRLDPIDYIRVHINNMYGYLFNKDVYYNKKYYKLLLTPKIKYFNLIKIKKECGNLNEIDSETIKNEIENALKEAEIIKTKSINKKGNIGFSQYKKIINSYIERIFNNCISAEEYEKEHGWDFKISVDGWSEDNYIVKYFCKSLTGYMKNYINKINGISRYKKYIECEVCGKITEINNKAYSQKYCTSCSKEKIKERDRIRKSKNNSIKPNCL